MKTETTPTTPPQSLAIVPHGDYWQAIPAPEPPPPLSLEQILDKMARQLAEIDQQIESINNTLRNL